MKTTSQTVQSIRQRQLGFSMHALVAFVAVVGIIGFAGYTVYSRSNQDTTPQSVVLQPDIPAVIRDESDLDKTQQALNSTDTKLDNQLGTSGLESDIKSLL